MKTRLERNKNGDTETNLEVVSVVLTRKNSDTTLGCWQWEWREVGGLP